MRRPTAEPRLPDLLRAIRSAVVWTSGTTGLPKGAVFDHACLAAVAAGTDVLSEPGDRRLSPLPFAHVGSMTRTWDEIANAVTTVITPTPWRAADAIRIIDEERITVAQGVPTQWALVLAHPDLDAADVSSLRIAGTGASRVPPSWWPRCASGSVCRWWCATPRPRRRSGPAPSPATPTRWWPPRSAGRCPGSSSAIADDGGEPVAAGEVGRVRLRSAAVMRGYWGGPPPGPGRRVWSTTTATTRSVLADDGWLTTGDFGFVGDDGYLHLVGRANELYIRGGYNVYPAEVEGVLGAHPAVEQVAVVGAPDPVLGEIGVAFVVLAAGPAAGSA